MIVGEASILIRPITAGFGKQLLEGADKELAASGATAGSRFGGMFAKGLAGIGIATAAIGIAAIKMGSDYQRSLLMIHTQAGATGENLGQITKQIFAMAPAVGFGPKALVDALYHIESVGYRGAQAMDILKIAAQGAKIGHEDLEKTANSLVATMASGITGFHGAAQAMGVLDAIIGAGNMRMDGLNAAIGTGLFASAQTFGISIQSVGAALAFMTDRGSGAQESATRLRMSIALMAAPSAAASKIMGTLGLSTTEVHSRTTAMSEALKKAHITTSMLASDLRKPDGFEVALRHLKTALADSGVSAVTASAIISRAFGGGRSGATIMAMYGNLDVLKGKFDQITRTSNNFGQSWAATQKTASFQFSRFTALVETGLTRLGMFLLPQVTRATKGLVDGVIAAGPVISRAWDSIMGGFRNPGAKLGASASVFNAVSPLNAILLSAGQNIRKFSDLLLPALRSAGSAIMGALGPTWDLIRNLARDLAPLAGLLLKVFAGAVIVGIRAFAVAVRDVLTPMIRFAGSLVGFLGKLAGNTAFQALAVGVAVLLVPFGALLVVLKGMELATAANLLITKAWTVATNIAKEATIAFRFAVWLLNAAWEANPIGVVVLALTALAAGLVFAYEKSKAFRDIVDSVGRVFRTLWDAITGGAAAQEKVKRFFSDLPGMILRGVEAGGRALADFGKRIPGWIMSGLGAAGGFGKKLLDMVVSGLATGGQLLADVGRRIPGWLWDGIKGAVNLGVGLLNLIHEGIQSGGRVVTDVAKKIPGWILDGIKSAVTSIPSFFANLFTHLFDGGGGGGGGGKGNEGAKKAGKGIVASIIGGLTGAAKDLLDWFTKLPGKIAGWVGSIDFGAIGKKILTLVGHAFQDAGTILKVAGFLALGLAAVGLAVVLILPAIGLAIAFALVTALLHALGTNWSKIGQFFTGAWNGIKSSAIEGMHAVGGAVSHGAEQIAGFFTRMWHDVTTFFRVGWLAITAIATSLWHDVTGVFNRIKTDVSNIVTDILAFIDRHWRLLLVIFTGPIGLVIVIVDYFHKQIGAFFTQMWHDVSGFVERMWHDVTTFFHVGALAVAAIAASSYQAVTGFVMRMRDDVNTFVSRMWHDVTGFFYVGWLAVTAIVTSLWRDVTAWVTRMWHDVSGFVVRMWNDVTAFFHVGYLAVIAIVTSLWNTVVDLFTRLWHDVTGWVTRMWTDVTTFFHVGAMAVTAIVTSLWRTVVDLFTRLWTDVSNWVTRMWHDVITFIMRMAVDAWDIVRPFVTRIVGGFGDLWTGATGFASRLWHDVAGFFGRMRDDVVGIFDDLVTKAGQVWDRVKDLVAVPIRWVIENPYDKGIVPLIRGIGDILHEPGMQNLAPLHFAGGGAVPGNHDRDDVPLYGTPGEVMVDKPTVARHGGPNLLMRALGMTGGGGTGGHYAVGGPVLPPGLNFQGLSSFNPNSLQGSLTAGTATGAAAGRQFVTKQDALRISGGKADTGILGRIVHDIAHPTDLLGDLKKLALGALAIGATPVVHTIEGAADGALKSLGEPGRWMDKEVHNIGDALLSLLAGKDAAYNAAQAAAAAAGGGAGLLQVGNGTDIVNDARKYLGQQYILGGDPYGGGGTDCSGLVDRVMADLGHKLPGRPLTWDLVKMGTAVNYADALPGDLVFTNYGEGGIPGPGHVGIYEGGGRMIDDPNPSSHVREEAVWETPGAVRRLLVDHLPTAVAAAAVNGSWADVVYQALKMENLPASAAGGVLRLIQSESGGDANAQNNWDSNARAGTPSQGLMQLIPGTFAANHWPGTSDNIRDPLANIAAGINYAVKTYGIGMLMGGGRHDGTGRYVGYEQGTMFVPSTGPATLHQGEIVIPRGPSDTIRQHMATGGVVHHPRHHLTHHPLHHAAHHAAAHHASSYAALYRHAVELYAKLITDQLHHLSPATIRSDIARIAVANRAADVARGHPLAHHHATHHLAHHRLHHPAHHLTHHPHHHAAHHPHHVLHPHHPLHPHHRVLHPHHPLHHAAHHLTHPRHHPLHHLQHPSHHAAHHAGWSALTRLHHAGWSALARLHHLQHPSHHAAHHAGWSALARLHHPHHWSALQRAHHPLHWSALERLHHPHHYRRHPRVFDTGGYLESGAVGVNLSGRRERVLNPDETATYDRTRGRTGTTVHQNNHFNGVDLPTAQAQAARELTLALAGAGVG